MRLNLWAARDVGSQVDLETRQLEQLLGRLGDARAGAEDGGRAGSVLKTFDVNVDKVAKALEMSGADAAYDADATAAERQ